MRKQINTIKSIILFVVILIIIAIFDPSLRSIVLALLNPVLILLPYAITVEDIFKIIILILILIAGITLGLSKREQSKLWVVLTGILELGFVIWFFIK